MYQKNLQVLLVIMVTYFPKVSGILDDIRVSRYCASDVIHGVTGHEVPHHRCELLSLFKMAEPLVRQQKMTGKLMTSQNQLIMLRDRASRRGPFRKSRFEFLGNGDLVAVLTMVDCSFSLWASTWLSQLKTNVKVGVSH